MERGPAAVVQQELNEDAPIKLLNRRHGSDFNKHKSSTAMQILLKSDEAT
jgi:hypothetical protein